jgi:hypothetical protein
VVALAFPDDDPLQRLIRQQQQIAAALAPAGGVARALQSQQRALGGAAARIAEQQRAVVASLVGPVANFAAQQRRIEELTSAPLRQIAEQQQRLADALDGPALAQQRALRGLAESPLARMREQQELIANAMGESLYRSLESVVEAALESAESSSTEAEEIREPEPASGLGEWVPTAAQAETLVEVARLIIIMVLLVSLRTGHAISETTQLELEWLMSFVIVLNKFRHR